MLSDILDKKAIKRFIKHDKQIDVIFMNEYHKHLICEKILELDEYRMRFNKEESKRKARKTEHRLLTEVESLIKNSETELYREKADNKRIYTPLFIDYRTAKIPRGANREELVALREKLINLLYERQEINLQLLDLYQGGLGKNRKIFEKRTTAEMKARRTAYQKQSKIEREITKYHFATRYAVKLRTRMDAYVMKFGQLASLRVAITERGLSNKSKREIKREMRKLRRDLNCLESEILYYRGKGLRDAQNRITAHRGMIVGWTIFFILCGLGMAGWIMREQIISYLLNLLF